MVVFLHWPMSLGKSVLQLMVRAYALLAAVLAVLAVVAAQPDGWAMTDRFHGFRYELTLKYIDNVGKYIDSIQMEADKRNCFGWVQQTSSDKLHIVGEVRCAKPKGEDILQWFRDLKGAIVDDVKILVYPDTKIRLHFSHFKVLDSDRDTCFLDEPHKCVDLISQDTEGTNVQPPTHSKEEL